MFEQALPEQQNHQQRKWLIFGIVLLYAILLITIDVGFILVTRQNDAESSALALMNKTQQQLGDAIITAFVVQQQHVFPTFDQERPATEEIDKVQNGYTEKEATA